MPDTKLLNLPAATNLDGTEYFYAVQGGNDVKVSDLQIARIPITANVTYYVSTTGDDAANGSVTNPWRTAQHAFDWIGSNLDFRANGPTITVQFADGSYVGPAINSWPTGNGTIAVQGNSADHSLVKFNESGIGGQCFGVFTSGVTIKFQDVTFQPITAGGDGVFLGSNQVVQFGGFDGCGWDGTAGAGLDALLGGFYNRIFLGLPWLGASRPKMYVSGAWSNSFISFTNYCQFDIRNDFSFTAGTSFGFPFFHASNFTRITWQTTTVTGNPTCTRYWVFSNSIVSTNVPITSLPGTSEGVIYPTGRLITFVFDDPLRIFDDRIHQADYSAIDHAAYGGL